MEKKERLKTAYDYLRNQGKVHTQSDVASIMNATRQNVSAAMSGKEAVLTNNFLRRFNSAFGDIFNTDWLLTGEGNMLKGVTNADSPRSTDTTTANLIPLLPIAARGGSLSDFASAVKNCDCEFVVSPIKGADFAMPISGDSMAPEYPNGAQILIKKIDESAFVEWGKAYVLDTRNGAVVKILVPSDKEDCVRCVSINKDPIFAPFDVCWSDVFGVYRVMMCMALK